MITAEEFLDSRYPEFNHLDSGNIWVNVENLMIDFAKLHVEAALKKASETKVEGIYSSTKFSRTDDDENFILNAYPLELIK